MKRSVKMWAVVDKPSGQIVDVLGTRENAWAFVHAGYDSSVKGKRAVPGERAVPCIVTYDDGRKSDDDRKSPRRKRQEVKRG